MSRSSSDYLFTGIVNIFRDIKMTSFRPAIFLQLYLIYFLSDISYCARRGGRHRANRPLICGRSGSAQVHDIGAVYPQSPERSRGGRCPPSPDELMREACDVCMCWSDSQCGPDQKCCYNGCMQTCLHKVKPPPVLDWLIEPTKKPILAQVDTWLVPGPEMGDPAESCSTSVQPVGESPLRCPTGYQCAIEDSGDPENGIPNRGICVKP